MRGDHIKVRRYGYTHHGIDLGNGNVVHFSGESKFSASIREEPIEAFSKGYEIETVQKATNQNEYQIIIRARNQIGQGDYNLIFNNCEHFARWCHKDGHSSRQVDVGHSVFSTAIGVGAGAFIGPAVAASTVTVMGSSALGGAALTLGLVSAPVWPVVAVGAAGAAVVGASILGIRSLMKPSR
jgi:hypothetical protein